MDNPGDTISKSDADTEVEEFDLEEFREGAEAVPLEDIEDLDAAEQRAIWIYCNSVYITPINGVDHWIFRRSNGQSHTWDGACGSRSYRFRYKRGDSAHVVGKCKPSGRPIRKIFRK